MTSATVLGQHFFDMQRFDRCTCEKAGPAGTGQRYEMCSIVASPAK